MGILVVLDRWMRWKLPTVESLLHLRAAVLTQPLLDLQPYTEAPAPSVAA